MLTGLTIAVLAALPAGQPQDPHPVLRAMHARQQKRWATVQNYTVIQRFNGMPTPLYHERISVDGQIAFRLVPPPEWDRQRTGLSQEQTEAIAHGMATGLDLLGDGYMREVGGPGGLYLKSMTTEMAYFLRQVGNYDEDETMRSAVQGIPMAAAFARRARLAGREEIGGRAAHVIRAQGLSDVKLEQAPGAPEFSLEQITLWVDVAEEVPLRLLMEGKVAGGSNPIVIELLEQAYRAFGPLFEPTRRTMRITGLMEAMATDPKKKQELAKVRASAEKSQAELKRMEQQLATMPAGTRRMIEGQLARARQQMAMLVNQGTFTAELELEVIGVNQGPPRDWKPGS